MKGSAWQLGQFAELSSVLGEERCRYVRRLLTFGVLRITGFWAAKERLERDKGGFKGKDWGPCIFKDIQTYCPLE